MRYIFREGSRFSSNQFDPQAVGKELERCRNEDGGLHPEVVVSRAENPESPLHHAFEWDDSEAARQYRLDQARLLIRSVRVIHESKNEERPAYVHVPGRKQNGAADKTPPGRYVSSDMLQDDEDMMERAVDESLHRLAGAANSLSTLLSLAFDAGHKHEEDIRQAASLVDQAKDIVNSIRKES